MVGAVLENVKLTSFVRAVTVSGWTVGVVLQVTPNVLPSEASSCKNIAALPVAAVVFTTRVADPAATATTPITVLTHTAGDAEEAQVGLIPKRPAIVGVVMVGLICLTIAPVPTSVVAAVGRDGTLPVALPKVYVLSAVFAWLRIPKKLVPDFQR